MMPPENSIGVFYCSDSDHTSIVPVDNQKKTYENIDFEWI